MFAMGSAILMPQANAQGRGPQASAQAMAPVDLTGYYVSIVTEDWRYRMVTPAKGDVASVPLNQAGRDLANRWDPAKDEAAGEQCKAYGAPGLMRIPGRIQITWQDDNTLKVETDAGSQTRLFHFNAAPEKIEPSLEGYSIATWEIPGAGRGGRGAVAQGPPVTGGVAAAPGGDPGAAGGGRAPMPGRGGRGPAGGSLKVVTTHLKPGYLRKNGVPYGALTVLTEYYSRTMEPNGDSWLIITTAVDDPEYLNGTYLTSTHFKRQVDNSGWAPSPCRAR
jgi:hypothetical protein